MIVTLSNQDSGHLVVVVVAVVLTEGTNINMMKTNDLTHKGKDSKMMNQTKVPQRRRM